MTRRIEGEGWSIEPPSGWLEKTEPECTILTPGERGGALQISAHQKAGAKVTEADCLEFAADHLEAGAPRRDVRLGDFVGFEIAYDADGYSCREWTLRAGSTLLFVTYTCDAGAAERHDDAVERALITLRA